MRLTAPLLLGLLAVAAWALVPWMAVAQWAMLQQREFQNAMAGSLRAIQSGETAAIGTLCLATFAYGVVHAIGPGHGKVLLGGAALASGATLRRMAALTLAASLAQSATAIVLVAVMLGLLRLTSADAVALTETWLAPLSYAAVGAIGLVLIVRGARAIRRSMRHRHHAGCGCGHAHGPSLTEVRSLTSARDAAALIAGIALRPCTGALFLLVIAARFEVFAVGVLAVVAMGLGTAAFNLLVAASGVAARGVARLGGTETGGVRLSAGLHLAGGGAIVLASVLLLRPYLA